MDRMPLAILNTIIWVEETFENNNKDTFLKYIKVMNFVVTVQKNISIYILENSKRGTFS